VTLVEILVAGSIFLVLAGCLILLYQVGLGARRKQEAQRRPHKAATLCLSYLRSELKVVQLLSPSALSPLPEAGPVSELRYRRPALDRPLELDSAGIPLWSQVCRLVFEEDRKLWRYLDQPVGPPRALVYLGSGGELSFTRINDQLLSCQLRADFGESVPPLDWQQNFLLSNQP